MGQQKYGNQCIAHYMRADNTQQFMNSQLSKPRISQLLPTYQEIPSRRLNIYFTFKKTILPFSVIVFYMSKLSNLGVCALQSASSRSIDVWVLITTQWHKAMHIFGLPRWMWNQSFSVPTWKGKMSEEGSLQACLAPHGSPTSQHMRHCSVIWSRIFLETVSSITGRAAIRQININYTCSHVDITNRPADICYAYTIQQQQTRNKLKPVDCEHDQLYMNCDFKISIAS